jgi:gamma-glutamylcyclotransferase (GGCT)/AIG2-like uncharacterized protein YtfP
MDAPSASCHRLFVYGTLVDPARLDEVLGHRHNGERLRAQLNGYHRVVNERYPYPFIVLAEGGVVDGVVLEDLSADDLHMLDRYEEVDEGVYYREMAEVEVWGCGPSTPRALAYVYVAGPALAMLAAR